MKLRMIKTKEAASTLSHVDATGRARMVDVSGKAATRRKAVAESFIRLRPSTLALIAQGRISKGNVLETARLAGILAAKGTPHLIPLCHPLLLSHVDIDAQCMPDGVRFISSVTCTGPTGAEMEALMAVSMAALTLYDMIKAVEKGATIESVRLLRKSGGKSGVYHR